MFFVFVKSISKDHFLSSFFQVNFILYALTNVNSIFSSIGNGLSKLDQETLLTLLFTLNTGLSSPVYSKLHEKVVELSLAAREFSSHFAVIFCSAPYEISTSIKEFAGIP